MSEGQDGPQGAMTGGSLAVRMMSLRAMAASQMKRAANDKTLAQTLASHKSGPPAARLGDKIQHKSFLGALAGAVVGAIVTIAEGCLIMAACATGPYALVLVPALMYASYKADDYVEEKQNQLETWINSFCDPDGAINTGSKNVKINGKPAARAAVTLPPPPPPEAIPSPPQGEPSWGDIASGVFDSAMEKAAPLGSAYSTALSTLTDSNASFMDRATSGASLLLPGGPVLIEFAEMVGGRGEIKKDVNFPEAGEDTAICDKENKPPRIAQGSSSVFINNQPAARQGDKLECSAAIVEGSPNVFIGGGQVTYLDIQPEFPPWQRAILGAITIASYLLPPAAMMGKLGKLGSLLGKLGKLLGPKLGALLARGGKIKGAFGKFVKWLKDPVDPVTGAFCDERTDFTLGQTLPLSFTRFHSSVLSLHGLTGAGWSDSWSDYAWVRERGRRVDIAILGDTLSFAFEGGSETAVNPYHAQFILRRRDDYLELFDRDALSSRFFYDAFPGMRLRHPVTDDTENPRLAHTAGDRMYVLGGMSDTANNRITFERDSQYRLTGVSHTDGIRLRMVYHDSGYLKTIQRTDNGVQTLAEYRQDAQGRLTEADARLDYHLFYDYDDAGRIVRWSDNDQTWCGFTYDIQGRVAATGGAEGYYSATLEYCDGYTTVTDGKGTSHYHYDVDGNILREVATDGSVTTYQWDEYHHLLARQSPAGRLERFAYDASHGQLTRYTAADGAQWRYGYDARGLLASVTDPAGQTWTQQCDERGLPVSLVSPQGEETRLEYTPHGLLSGIFRRDERRLSVRYDRHNRMETLTDAMSREHHTEYSSHDLPVRMRGPGGQDARLQWQAHHKLSGLQRSGTGTEGFEYDRHGNLLTYTDGNSVQWRMEYGPFDLPVARADGEGNRWQYRYDKDTLQLTEVINPQGESYRYRLDNMGRVAEERDWGGVTWRYQYDADGLCTGKVNGLEETTYYGWDAAGRLAEVTTAEGKTQYAYDQAGRLTGIFSPDSEQRTAYDERGRVTVVTQGRRAIEYHYPDERTVTRCILPPEEACDKHPDELLLKTTYRYNAVGELGHITLPGGETLAFTRDEAGREIRREGSCGFVQEQGWNATNQLVSQRAGYYSVSSSPGTSTSLYTALSRDYRYDNAGNLAAVTERGETGSETRREYQTDRNGQITTVTVTGGGRLSGEGNEYYRYDSCGYLESQAAGRYRTGDDDLYRRGHRLKRSGNTEYEYDAAGRMVSRTRHRDGYRPEREQFRWDSRDQLTGYSNGKGEQWEYRYDGSGRRTEKRCDNQGIRLTYLWDGDSIAEIREYRHDVLSSVRHLVFSGFELVSQQVSRERQAHPTEPVRWMTRTVHAVSEPTGRPLMFFNSAGEAVRRPRDTTLWGRTATAATGDPDLPRRREDEEADPGLLYAGQWRDAESGLCYNRFRYYEPESGMYLVSDPLGLQGGANTYAYVPNPCGYVDPLGLAFCPRMQKSLQKLADRAVADIINNPKLAQELMSAGSYAHLKNATELYAASFGKAVERRMAQLIQDNPKLSKLVDHTGQARGENGKFISSPDFTTQGKGVFDVTTRKALQAHIDRYTTAGVYTPDNDIGYLVYDVVYGLSF